MKKTIKANPEFASELVCVIPHAYWLHQKGLLEKVKSDKADVAEVSEGFGIGWAKFGAEDKKEQEEDRKRLEQSQRQLAEARAKLQSMGGSLQDNSTRVDASKTSTTHVNGSIPMTNQNDAVRMAAAGAS